MYAINYRWVFVFVNKLENVGKVFIGIFESSQDPFIYVEGVGRIYTYINWEEYTVTTMTIKRSLYLTERQTLKEH